MELQAITCPNCGANTSNHQNCEYCGSFLVRQVSRGVDVSGYVERIPSYHNEVLLTLLKKLDNLIKRFIESNIPENIDPGLFIQFGNAWVGNNITGILINFDRGKDSYCISLATVELEGLGIAKEEFMNSEIGSFFTYSEEDCLDDDEFDMSMFEIEFGHDIKGIADFTCQLLNTVFKKKENQINYTISVNGDNQVSYNAKGFVTKELGCGANEFADISALKSDGSTGKGKLWLAILFFIACGIVGYFKGGTIGILMIIVSVFIVIAGIVGIVKDVQS